MPIKRKITAGVLNIKTHPHSPELYFELFQDIFDTANSVKIRGADYATPGWYADINYDQPLEGIRGEFYKFLNINPHDPWFNQRSREVIEIDDDEKEPPVPEHLKPNLHRVKFIFFPKNHRMVFDIDKFSPNSAKKVFESLCSFSDIQKKYGQVDVEVETSREAIERILKIPAKTKLEIRVTLPNPDDFLEEEARILKRLTSQNARRVDETYIGDKGEGLNPNDETITLMKVAQSNGYVKATGYNEGNERIEFSTLNHPLKDSEYYLPENKSRLQALLSLSNRLIAAIFTK